MRDDLSKEVLGMKDAKKNFGQKGLQEDVLNAGLCTNCGACVNICPYAVSYQDPTVIIDRCDRDEGRCYAFCPRTPSDLQVLRESLFDSTDLTQDLGPLKGFYMTRAADTRVRELAQHGGTVTALLSLALEEGLIDGAVVTQDGGEFLPEGVMVKEPWEVQKHAKSKFVVSPTIATFNKVAKTEHRKIGVVATPCQALALAKMRLKPFYVKDNNIEKLGLVIGLFCGWTLSWQGLTNLLSKKASEEKAIIGLDIPPSKYHRLEVYTGDEVVEISLDEVLPSVRTACQYCFDMTGEFSDISVGSARSPEGWEVAKGWNQVIVRSQVGSQLFELAKSRGILEFREMPVGNLEKLKRASLNKKRAAVKNLIAKSGSRKNLLYLDWQDPLLRTLLD